MFRKNKLNTKVNSCVAISAFANNAEMGLGGDSLGVLPNYSQSHPPPITVVTFATTSTHFWY